MLAELTANADLRGHRIDVSWTWSGLDARPAFRLLRRRRAYPAGPDDGYRVLDVDELFGAADEPWARVARARYVAGGSAAEGGLLQAEVAFFHDAPGGSDPARIEVTVHDPAVGSGTPERIEEVSRVELTEGEAAPWGSVEALEIFHTPGGGPEAPAGTLTVFRDHSDGTTPSSLLWEPAGGVAVEVELDRGEVLQTRADVDTLTGTELSAAWPRVVRLDGWDLATALADPETADPGALEEVQSLTLREAFSEDTGDWTRTFEVVDFGAATEETSYYRVFHPDPSDPTGWAGDREWRVHATASARYGFPDRVYGFLPSMHKYYDEPTPEKRDQGQLRRFLQVFGVALDHLRSGAEGLRARHDVGEVRGDFLPALGSWVDWQTDRTAPLAIQRSEIRMAPAVYETVGTLPNVVALATRVTGWPCEAKEFVHNLFLTNAPEAVPIREVWEMVHDGADFGGPVRLTTTEHFDGRPAPVVDVSGRTWLFFHSNRSGRWEIWFRILDGEDSTDPEPLDPPSEDEPQPTHSDLAPTAVLFAGAGGDELWLFWESNRDGPWDLWARVNDGTDWGAPFRVTNHAAPDRRPAAALGEGGTLWLFWESERRGASEVWARVWDGAAWTPPVRVTEGLGRDREPAAALDPDGRLRLVWRRDEADRSRLYTRIHEADAWGPVAPLEDGPWRDESPALVRRGTDLWLLWHSDRTGRWELWGRVHDGVDWGEPFQITQKADPDKEPVAILDGADLRIFWRSERLAKEYRSRTVDTSDTSLLERRGRFTDRIHYTYDTARERLDWYARDVVGLYLTPPPGTSTETVGEVLERAGSYLEPFTPATVRLVLIADRPVESVDFSSDGIEVDDWIVDDFDDEIE
jgi:phage tail-like protein